MLTREDAAWNIFIIYNYYYYYYTYDYEYKLLLSLFTYYYLFIFCINLKMFLRVHKFCLNKRTWKQLRLQRWFYFYVSNMLFLQVPLYVFTRVLLNIIGNNVNDLLYRCIHLDFFSTRLFLLYICKTYFIIIIITNTYLCILSM